MTVRPGIQTSREATPERRSGLGVVILTVVMVAASVAACDVVNPGPVQDEFLSAPESQAPLVRGAERRISQAIKNLGYTAALPAREIFPGGQTGAHGHSVLVQSGHILDRDAPQWANLQQARFIAESALERFINQGAIPADQHASHPLIARAHLAAGFGLRLMGEHYCDVVIDGGPAEPASVAFERAENHFTRAIEVAGAGGQTDIRLAALAGRAQVRAWLGNWGGVASDAALVPTGFNYFAVMDNTVPETRNRIQWANAGTPYLAYSVLYTFYHGYFEETGDPRAAWAPNPQFQWANASLSGYGQVQFLNQQKYTNPSDDIRLAGGTDMRLLEAEASLLQGNWQEAMTLINQVRTGYNSELTGDALDPWVASSLEEAWAFLKRERSIELWLEARRFGDLRRWEEQAAPGVVDWPDYESKSGLFSENPRSRCISIQGTERDLNPNVPEMPTAPEQLWAAPGSRPGQG